MEKGDKYYNQNYLNQLENRDFDMKDLASLADQSGFGMYDENTNILGFINPTDRVDLRASMKKAVEGQKFEYDKAGKKLDVVGYGANREPVYRMSLQDKDNTINAVKNSISPQAVPYMLMELGYSKEDQTKMTPAELTQTLDQELDKVYGLYATQEQMGARPPQPGARKPTYGVTDDNIGDVSFSGKPTTVVSTESSTPEQIKQGRIDYVTNELQGPYDVAKGKGTDDIEDDFGGTGGFESVVESYGLGWYVPTAPGRQEVEITAKGVAHLLDPTKPDFVQKVTDLIISGGSEVAIADIASTPETTAEKFLTPDSDSFFANLAGGKTPITDWAIPAGATVILTGDQGAVEVKLKNDMTFEKGKFQKAAKYKDKSGDTDTYYDIMFPIDQRDKEAYFTNLFNDSDVLTEFKKLSPDQLPKSMYVKQDNGLFKSLLSVLQTSKNVGTMTEGSLQKAMDKFMKPMSTSGTASTTTSTTSSTGSGTSR